MSNIRKMRNGGMDATRDYMFVNVFTDVMYLGWFHGCTSQPHFHDETTIIIKYLMSYA